MTTASPDVRVRRHRAGIAALVLGILALGPGRADSQVPFEDLVANLKSPTARTRQDAVAALGKSRRREAVQPLSSLVRDPEPKVRLEVVRALRELRDPAGVPSLVTSLQDGDPSIREEAISTLVEIYSERQRTGPIGSFLQGFADEHERASLPTYRAVDPSVFRGLAARLRDEKKEIREAAAFALGILGGAAVLPELQASLQDPEPGVRAAAATAIGKIGAAEEGRAVVPLLADESATVRNRALQAVGVLKVKEAGPALREMFERHRKRETGAKVLAALARTGDPTQADLYRELLRGTNPEYRQLAAEGLGRIESSSMLEAFKKDYQREGNDGVKLAYSFALTRLGDRAFLDTIVLSLSSTAHGARARGYLQELGPPVAPDLYPYLNDQDAEVRGALCDVLAEMGDPAAIPRITPLLNDPNSKVADRANRAIERLRRAESTAQPRP